MNQRGFFEWLNYIGSIHASAIDLDLSRIEPLAKQYQLTEFACPVIIVGGTNGKGSTVRFLESIYLAAGYRVAAYTSPHLIRFNERLRFDNEDVADEHWIAAFAWVDAIRQQQSLSFFEFTTLAALKICQTWQPQVLLLEVGLGGRLDAVNVVNADLAIITNIALDHTDWLGDTREQIGYEKAGIFRAHKNAICGDPNPPSTIFETAQQKSVRLFCLNRDYQFSAHAQHWEWQGPHCRYVHLPLPHLKLQNAATSLMAIELMQFQLPVTQFAIIAGLKNARLPGRFEQQSLPQTIIFDVAHNPDSAQYLAEQLQQRHKKGRYLAVVGMLKDKAIAQTLLPLKSLIDAWYLGGLDLPRGADIQTLSEQVRPLSLQNCYTFADVVDAYSHAIVAASAQDVIIVFGSFHTVANIKALG